MLIKTIKNTIIRIIPKIFLRSKENPGNRIIIDEIIKPSIILYTSSYLLFTKYVSNLINIIIPIIVPIKNGIYNLILINNNKGLVTSTIISSYIPKQSKKNELLTPGNIFPKEKNKPPKKYLKKEYSDALLLLVKISNNNDIMNATNKP